MTLYFGSFFLMLGLLLGHPLPVGAVDPVQATDAVLPRFQEEPIQPILIHHNQDAARVALGKALFHDPRLSADDTLSCAHCHPLEAGGTDGLRVSVGIRGQEGSINTPTVLNSGLNFRQFWDGRAASLEEQVHGPVTAANEMGSRWAQVLEKLGRDTTLVRAFRAAYDDGLTEWTITQAIATFERTLITPNGPFDRYLKGDLSAITATEIEGYALFKSYGCIACHQGRAVGGNMYQKMGIVRDYFAERGNIQSMDYGRFNVTGKARHRFRFKVPSLRNVARTAPYFHDGLTPSLEEAVRKMARYQIGRPIPEPDLLKIVAFLKTLSGPYPGSTP